MSKSQTKKTAPTTFDLLPEIRERWSPRVFSDRPVTRATLDILLEAGRWAPSSNNIQPWVIIYGIKGDETYQRIFDCFGEFNKSWAGNAPVLMLIAYNKYGQDGKKENFHATYDCGQYMAMFSIQAQHEGIAVHQMAGINHAAADKEFKLPEHYYVATGVALGYYGGDPAVLPEELRKMEIKQERERKPHGEFVFNGDFKK
ncbi:MAG: nitroreductase [Cytophagaceae bacterium]|nr:nitroreductase [Cytophagaceae bacterium]